VNHDAKSHLPADAGQPPEQPVLRGRVPEVDAAPRALAALKEFVRATDGLAGGAVMTDLDGTAVLEHEGRVVIPDKVALALRELHLHGCTVVLNTLRFPLNVVRTFGRAWYAITDAPLPLVSLNGSVLGHLVEGPDGEGGFQEIDAFPLPASAIEEVLAGVEALMADGVDDILLFRYARDWTRGERIWTPRPDRVEPARARYVSASAVETGPLAEIAESLRAEPICMILLLVNAERDRLMAYQHAQPSRFITAPGVDKRSGAVKIARRLKLDLARSAGAGDTPVDSFLAALGLAIHVGPLDIPHRGLSATVQAPDVPALGAVLADLAELVKESRQ
jgi:hydroxymethylpyrimidine pyrophosphatase-like HAD family hydrolase